MNFLYYPQQHFPLLTETVRSLIEIFILAAGIYFIWKLFRGTRGARVLAEFGFLLAALSLSLFSV
jgi:hypothetical protein